MSTPWWFCPPKTPPDECPIRPEGFIPFSEYDAGFKYGLGSSRITPKIECCYNVGHTINPPCPEDDI